MKIQHEGTSNEKQVIRTYIIGNFNGLGENQAVQRPFSMFHRFWCHEIFTGSQCTLRKDVIAHTLKSQLKGRALSWICKSRGPRNHGCYSLDGKSPYISNVKLRCS